ncbi:hypothetical protein DFR58_1033 [Anaerobacterium chartisolvens]|uniref:Uncharacterized protein n=1 Tax=Anaerobacterium chartisolvens TaxID=1297424 RepID=A0A369BCK0_9FIRM|nr:hypothetical protein [Anaerobacterium chartisolvens]RCX19259.1 hypothetical protein DFR58_1033 [Anaerobacterium chartisolvens]
MYQSNRLYKALIFALACVILLSACSNSRELATPSSNPILAARSAAQNASDFSSLHVKYIIIRDIQHQQEIEQKNPGIVNEFLQFLGEQKYSKSRDKWSDEYSVKLMGKDDKQVLEIFFSPRTVTLDSNIGFGDTMLEKGTYEVPGWITAYLKSYYDGQVLNPSNIKLPAVLKINGDIAGWELADKGSTKINLYDVVPRLNDIVNNSIAGRDYEITAYKTVYDPTEMESEAELMKSRNRCISINFDTSENFLEIDSSDDFKSYAKAAGMIIACLKDEPYIYSILTDQMIFTVRVDKELDRQFNQLFELNASTVHRVTPDEIKALSDSRNPNFMEYVSKNLGLDGIELRPDYSFKIESVESGSGQLYKLLDFTDSYTTRLLIFRNIPGKQADYIGNVDIKGWGDNIGYKIKKLGNKTFVVAEKNLMGHGTGFLAWFQDWYLIENDTVKAVLSIPSIYEQGEAYGFNLELKDLKIKSARGLSLTASYNLSKYYDLKLPIADEYGYVTVKAADKQVEFVWDDTRECFASKYRFDDRGIWDFISDSPEITNQCGKIFDKYHVQLENDITAILSGPEDAKRWKVRPYEAFLKDCKPDEKKERSIRKLMEAYPE